MSGATTGDELYQRHTMLVFSASACLFPRENGERVIQARNSVRIKTDDGNIKIQMGSGIKNHRDASLFGRLTFDECRGRTFSLALPR